MNRIIIDSDIEGIGKGSENCITGNYSKDFNLKVSKTIVNSIRNRLSIDVLLTRHNDKQASIQKRLDIVNSSQSDLLISIQTNSDKNSSIKGIKTYYLNLFSDENVLIQWVENQSAYRQSSGDLQKIIKDLLISSKISESETIAKHLQSSIYESLMSSFPEFIDLGIEQAPIEILLGSHIPSIVISIDNISNGMACKILSSEIFWGKLSEGIMEGIIAFVNDTSL